ncbi:MAG: rhomboid family intramembrane serine protease [Rhodobacteraceae bacterium]|nr:rhomboid family intramembrane serine protease [Paracoccaceae bacterium]
MFPIRDHNPSGRTPYVTYALIVLNIAVFISYAGLFQDVQAINAFFLQWAILPARISTGAGLETLLTSMFLHGGLMHLAGNMLFLWIFGDNMEDEMGHGGFLAFYIAAGLAAGLVHVVSAPGSVVPTVGASGAIAGVMGGYLLLFPKARIDILIILLVFFKILPIPAWILLAVWFAMQTFGSFGSDPDAGGVAYWAHSGGFVAGLAMTVPLWLRLGGTSFWRRNQGQPPHPEGAYRIAASRIPRIRR